MKGKKIITLSLAVVMGMTMNCMPVGAAKKAKVNVKKVSVESSITGNSKSVVVAKGKTVKLNTSVVVKPAKKANMKVSYKVANKKIAAVSAKGVVKGKAAGKTVITVTSKKNSKKKAKISVKVVAKAVNKVSLKQKSATLTEGQSLTLKATVAAKKGADKTLVWSSSNKKVATVNSKGVVKTLKAGKAVITATAADGSKKKASCTVTVNPKAVESNLVNIASVKVLNERSIAFSLDKAMALDMTQVVVKRKSHSTGKYNNVLKINNMTTANTVDYTIVLDNDNRIYEGNFICVEIAALTGPTKVMEIEYREPVCAYTGETVSSWTVGKYGRTYLSNDGYGYSSYTISALPAGLTSQIKDDSLEIKGTPTQAGPLDAVLSAVDEFGNTLTQTVHFIVGSDAVIVGAATQSYSLIGTDTAYASIRPSFVGGSGNYQYSVVSDPINLVTNKDANGLLVGYEGEYSNNVLVKPLTSGTYTVTVRATDKVNPVLFADVNCVFNVKQGIAVGGMLKDAEGNPMSSGTISFTNKDKTSKYCRYMSESVYKVTGDYSVVVEPGVYDICASYSYGDYVDDYNSSRKYLYSQLLDTARTGYDIQLENIYKVMLTSPDKEFKVVGKEWYCDDVEVGYSSYEPGYIYLKNGTYKLKSEKVTTSSIGDWFNGYKSEKAEYVADVVVNGASVTAPLTKVVDTQSATTTPGAKDTIYSALLDGKYWLNETGSYGAYSFTPSETGKYKISNDSVYIYDMNNNKLVKSEEGSYYTLTADTKYIIGNPEDSDYSFVISKYIETSNDNSNDK